MRVFIPVNSVKININKNTIPMEGYFMLHIVSLNTTGLAYVPISSKRLVQDFVAFEKATTTQTRSDNFFRLVAVLSTMSFAGQSKAL